MSCLDEVLEGTKRLETPAAFWYWSILSSISAVTKDNIWLERDGAFKLYPNIYVMLLARSGLKKGLPVKLAKDLAKLVNNTRIITGRSSIQGILKELGSGSTLPGGKILTKSVGYVIASEFSSSLVEDRAAMTILTDLYDRHWNEGDWGSLLKMEKFNLKDPTVSMLVATNNSHFKDFIPEKDMFGGFIGRMFVISEDKRNCLNPLLRKTDLTATFTALKKKLAEHFHKIAALQGEMVPDEDALCLYENWYREFYNAVDEQLIEDESGTVDRFGDSVLKVAMLIALANNPELRMTRAHVKEAIDRCERLVGDIRKVTMGKGRSGLANQKALIIGELLKRENHEVTRAFLLKRFWMHFDSNELDQMTRSLDEAGVITLENRGGQIIYRMPDNIADEMNKMLQGRSSGGKK